MVVLSFQLFCLVGEFIVCKNPIDAIPDLSENQVIVFWNGWEEAAGDRRSSNILWFPIQSPKLSASSMFGMSFVYII
jgi:Cu/Ag efflux pump CusA